MSQIRFASPGFPIIMCLDQLPFLEPEGIVGLPFISFGLPLLSVCFPHPYQWNVCTTANLTIQNMGRQVMVWANGDTSYFVLYLRYSPRYEKSPSCLPDRLLSDPPESKSLPFIPTYYSFYTNLLFLLYSSSIFGIQSVRTAQILGCKGLSSWLNTPV